MRLGRSYIPVDLGRVSEVGERGLRVGGGHDVPLELCLEVLETGLADPGVVVVGGDVPRGEVGVVGLFRRELGVAERAVVVVPAWPVRGPVSPAQVASGQPGVLAHQPPIAVSHSSIMPHAVAGVGVSLIDMRRGLR